MAYSLLCTQHFLRRMFLLENFVVDDFCSPLAVHNTCVSGLHFQYLHLGFAQLKRKYLINYWHLSKFKFARKIELASASP